MNPTIVREGIASYKSEELCYSQTQHKYQGGYVIVNFSDDDMVIVLISWNDEIGLIWIIIMQLMTDLLSSSWDHKRLTAFHLKKTYTYKRLFKDLLILNLSLLTLLTKFPYFAHSSCTDL